MKRVHAILLLLAVSFCLFACSGAETKVESKQSAKNVLVVYFSQTGTTRTLAEYAAEILGADLFEIQALIPYAAADIAYYTNCRADIEQSDPSARPEIANRVANMEGYDTILLGYPIWHGQAPRIIYTFLESYDFTGKTIVPFCTSQSSGLGSSDRNLHPLCPSTTIWKDGRRFAGGTSKDEIANWLQKTGIGPAEK